MDEIQMFGHEQLAPNTAISGWHPGQGHSAQSKIYINILSTLQKIHIVIIK